LRIESTVRDGVVVVVPVGVLDVVSYARVRTALVKLALDVPRALIVDMAKLVVPDDASLVVFTSVWKEVSEWPGVPLHLVAANDATKMRLRRNGIFRHIPVHDTVDQAIAGIDQPPSWRRAVFTIPHGGANGNKARRCIERTCHRWACVEDIIADATVIAFELLENAMRRTAGDVRLRLELRCGKLIVAVHDNAPTHVVAGSARHTKQRLGLAQVDSLAYSWGSAPAFPQGTVVWAALRV
jgi:anti-anti-sigma factor